jgi:chromosome segregation ATPase
VELEAARASALNDTSKTDNSFSINYDKKNARNQSKLKEIDQHKSENEILKAKLARLEEQVEKKKANIEIEAAIERTKQLKENIETANLDLVDWKNNVSDQEEQHADLKKELAQLHKKICALLTTEKELVARKKGEEVEKELNQVRNAVKKNTAELDKLKKELEASKAKVKELELRAKKLNSEKEVLRKGGRKGPYSSAGSVRSYNSFNSSKKSYNSGVSSSKPRSNYSYNSNKYR